MSPRPIRLFAGVLVTCSLIVAATFPAQALAARGWIVVHEGIGQVISDNGVMASCDRTEGGELRASVIRGERIEDLGPGCAQAVNNHGEAAGALASGELVLWSHGAVIPLGIKGNVTDINEAGVVVGNAFEGAGGPVRGFIYDHGALTIIPTIGEAPDPYNYSSAAAINARGQVVGSSNGQAFIYQDGTVTPLGTFGGSSSGATDINDRGQVVGGATTPQGRDFPFLWDGVMHMLPGPPMSAAVAINNRGQVLGSGEGIRGFLIEGDTYTALKDLLTPQQRAEGWHSIDSIAITNQGWILASAFDADTNPHIVLLVRESGRWK